MITKTIPEVFMGEDGTQTLGVECAVELQSVRENFLGWLRCTGTLPGP